MVWKKKFGPLLDHWHLHCATSNSNDKSVNNFAISQNWASIARFMIAAELVKEKEDLHEALYEVRLSFSRITFLGEIDCVFAIHKLGYILTPQYNSRPSSNARGT